MRTGQTEEKRDKEEEEEKSKRKNKIFLDHNNKETRSEVARVAREGGDERIPSVQDSQRYRVIAAPRLRKNSPRDSSKICTKEERPDSVSFFRSRTRTPTSSPSSSLAELTTKKQRTRTAFSQARSSSTSSVPSFLLSNACHARRQETEERGLKKKLTILGSSSSSSSSPSSSFRSLGGGKRRREGFPSRSAEKKNEVLCKETLREDVALTERGVLETLKKVRTEVEKERREVAALLARVRVAQA